MPVVLCVADETYLTKWDFCVSSQQAYAARCGYRRELIRTPVDGLNMKWSKLAHAAALLRGGSDAILLLDADTEVTPAAPAFIEVLDAERGADIFYVLGISGRANSGVLMLRGRGGLDLLEACLSSRATPVAKEHFVTPEGENGHLIAMLATPEFRRASHVLPLAWNCSQPDHAADAYVRHYTNRLRAALVSGKLPAFG